MYVLLAIVLSPSAAEQCMTGAVRGLASHAKLTLCGILCSTEKAMRSICRILPAIPDEAVLLLPFIQMSVSGEGI